MTTALVLHGGGGPATVATIAEHLASRSDVLAPTHPGWDGTPRPADVTTMHDVAAGYLERLAAEDRRDVVVVGSSLGGWIGADMAVHDADGRIAKLVLIDAVGIEVPGEPITPFVPDPATVTPAQAANMETMRVLAGDPYMCDPGLRARLVEVTIPVLALWGERDGTVGPAYGEAYAASFPDGCFESIPDAAHLVQLDQPALTFRALDAFLEA